VKSIFSDPHELEYSAVAETNTLLTKKDTG